MQAPDRDEPRGCTLADLMVLTVGVAVATSLYWSSFPGNLTTRAGGPMTGQELVYRQALEFTFKSCVALTPVILFRRWRFGGPLRPVEYLAIMTGISQLTLSMFHWPVLGITYRDPGSGSASLVNMEAFQVWQLSELSIGVLAGLALWIMRRYTGFDWRSGLLLIFFWQLTIGSGGYFYQEWCNGLATSQNWTNVSKTIFSIFMISCPQCVISDFPTAIALIDLYRSARSDRNWVEWTALLLTIPVRLIGLVESLVRVGPAITPFQLSAFLLDSHFVGSIVGALIIAWITEPTWRRFLFGSEPITSPDESSGRLPTS